MVFPSRGTSDIANWRGITDTNLWDDNVKRIKIDTEDMILCVIDQINYESQISHT